MGGSSSGGSCEAIDAGPSDLTFSAPINVPSNDGRAYDDASVALMDLNGDGALDLISIAPESSNGYSLHVALNLADGTFGPTATTPLPEPIDGRFSPPIGASLGLGLAVGRFVTLGHGDVAGISITSASTAEIWVLPGLGDGGFGTPVITAGLPAWVAKYEGAALVPGDVTGDGNLDLVMVSGARNEGLVVFPGRGDGTFTAPARTSYAGDSVEVWVADLNGDGKEDVIFGPPGIPNGTTLVALSKGNGQFTTPKAAFNGWAIAMGDLNNDGKPDLVAIGVHPDACTYP